MEWQSEFNYLLNRKILSRDELRELISQIEAIIAREIFPFQKKIEEYQTSAGWAWEEVKKYQDEIVKLKNSFLTHEEMTDIMKNYINNDDDWHCDGLVKEIYDAQEEKRTK